MENNQENIPPFIQPQPPEENWLSKNKIFLILFSFLILVALVGGLYFWKYVKPVSTKLENTVEKSVINSTTTPITPESFGFIIASTTDWKIQTVNLNETDIVQSFEYISPDNKKSFTISIFSNVDPEKTTLNAWAKADAIKYDSQAKEDQKSFKVGNNFGSIYTGEIDGKLYKREYLIRGIEKQIYRIGVEMDKNNSWMSDFDKIISTFSFTALNINSYQVYKNVQFAFELTYPSNWRTRDQSDGVQLRNYFNPTLDIPTNPKDITVTVMQNKNPNKFSLADWLAKDTFWTYASKSKDFIKINGNDAVKIYYERPNASYPGVINKGYTYLIARDKDIILSGYSSKDGSPDLVLDQIIMSIKFTAFDSKAYSTIINAETQTIVGQDNNHDGVWDYVGDYINQKYSTSAKIRAGLNQYAKALQQALIDNKDKEKSLKNSENNSKAIDCLIYITSKGEETIAGINEASKISNDVKAELLNTKDRSMAYLNYDSQLSGGFFALDEGGKTACDFDPDKLPN